MLYEYDNITALHLGFKMFETDLWPVEVKQKLLLPRLTVMLPYCTIFIRYSYQTPMDLFERLFNLWYITSVFFQI